MDCSQKARDLVKQMTLEEKASLCSGQNFWQLKGIERLGLTPVMLTDGPHGLRKQEGSADHLGINESVPATCFPPACATACSFDTDLMEELGAALGEECLQEDVAVVLGPGVNIKRSPLCGRNFEYFSEDPLLTGALASAFVNGVQGKGIGTSVKHFAANNQESCRMSSNSVIDERALHEIYLSAYEQIVREASPWTVMCSYNLINGTYASENEWLLTEMLRNTWGFEGLVVTDWGAVCDRTEGVRAGLDLEMPSSGGLNDVRIVAAVKKGRLPERILDRSAEKVTELILRAQAERRPDFKYDAQAHHALARRAASQSTVLLKNDDGILPLKKTSSVAIIGALAKTPRYQGAGSSKINPLRLENAHDALLEEGLAFEYADGYSLTPGSGPDEALIEESCRIAAEKDVVLAFVGLPDEYESEGFDRTNLNMPESHTLLIEKLAAVNPNIVVVLQLGAPVLMPWKDKVKGILLGYLGGQAGGSACANVLLGKVSPSGKLAESWPLALEDTPCSSYFPGGKKSVEYRESVFVGYRYYETANVPVAFPFGHGLSYTSFDYSELSISRAGQDNSDISVEFTIENKGELPGAEVVQIYTGLPESKIFRPIKELRGFCKVFLQPGESRRQCVQLSSRSFAYYNTAAKAFCVERGRYDVLVAASSQDVRLAGAIDLEGDGKEALLHEQKNTMPEYFELPRNGLKISDASFTALYGRKLPPSERRPGEPYSISSTLGDIKDTKLGEKILSQVKEAAAGLGEGNDDLSGMFDAMVMDMPLRTLVMLSGGATTPKQIDGMVDVLNGKSLRGYIKLLTGGPKRKA